MDERFHATNLKTQPIRPCAAAAQLTFRPAFRRTVGPQKATTQLQLHGRHSASHHVQATRLASRNSTTIARQT